MEVLLSYFARISVGLIFTLLLSTLIPKELRKGFHLILFIVLFIFTRDVMTPEGLWHFGTEGFFWIRFSTKPMVNIVLGVMSVITVVAMNFISPELGRLVVWIKGRWYEGILCGAGVALLIALPFVVFYKNVAVALRGGEVALMLLPSIIVIAFGANLYEEVLFRGYLQRFLEEHPAVSPVKAAILSGLFFSFGHIFLAYSVTDAGYSLILFAAFEGIMAGLVRMKYGVIPAAVTHGGAIFLLSSGLI